MSESVRGVAVGTGAPDLARFRDPPREFGILPFWFLNGELDPDEMRFQLRELREKGMHGVVFHGRYGLEMPYLGERYLERIRIAAEEAGRLGLATWIYDEMNWPSGTADKRVLRERPDLAQRYLECLGFTIHGPWFMCLTGEDSRYLDFERSMPIAAFAMGERGEVVDLTPNLSFEKVVPWEVPPGRWRLMYMVEKRADYYIDALDPESTAEFLRLGYRPYVDALEDGSRPVGFYSDEPAMHYFVTGGDNAVVPWTKDMFRRFSERNGYDLRPRLPDLFFDVSPDSARTRFDFYTTLTAFYSDAYYRQIHEWCRERGVIFTAHLLYEEWLRSMIRVEGNLFRHYEQMDVVAVDHLYPVIGTREAPDQHVAMKVASSAAHHFGSPRLICESFGGIFMDATMQRMKWIADWEYVLGVNLLNPHGFHYTLEGDRKRDWPPSMFYQYPWWEHYGQFSAYVARLSEMLTGGRHVADVAVLWPINAMFATYRPQERTPEGDRIERGFNELTDLLLRLHVDFDYLDEDVLAGATVEDGVVRVGDEAYGLVVIPPMTHVKSSTLDQLERLVEGGGRVLGIGISPDRAFADGGLTDVSERVRALFGREGRTAFVESDDGSLPADGIRDGLASLVEPDLQISNDEIFALHRERDGRPIYFLVNPTFEEQRATVTLSGDVEPELWDPSTGEPRHAGPSRFDEGRTAFELALPPVGSVFILPSPSEGGHVVESDAAIDSVSGGRIVAHGPTGSASVRLERGGEVHVARATMPDPPAAQALEDGWTFTAEDPNALVIDRWLVAREDQGSAREEYSAPGVDTTAWLSMVPGAWSYQLPAEPADPYPIAVWYRFAFAADQVPGRIGIVVDGWAGSGHEVHVNGQEAGAKPERSPFDSQMRLLDVTDLVRQGDNLVAVRLTLRGPTDGIHDRVKVVGDFSLAGDGGAYRIVPPRVDIRPEPWTGQGYPFYSGCGVYRTTVRVPDDAAGCRLFLEVPMTDDALEVRANGERAGVRLWDPYTVELTTLLRPGENELELRVANTPANLLSGVERPSGLAGPPTLVAHRQFQLALPVEDGR